MKFPLPQRSPLRAHPCILAVARGATAGTLVPASSRVAIFDSPISPAPTTKHFRPFSLSRVEIVFPSTYYNQYSLVLCHVVAAPVKRLPCSGGRAHLTTEKTVRTASVP